MKKKRNELFGWENWKKIDFWFKTWKKTHWKKLLGLKV